MGAALALGACGLGAGGRNTAAVVVTGGLVGEPLSGRMHCGEKITIIKVVHITSTSQTIQRLTSRCLKVISYRLMSWVQHKY